MDESVSARLRAAVEPHINRDSGNIIMIVASSEAGKSTLTTQVLMRILSKSNGFITSVMTPNYDSIPFQKLIMDNVKQDKNGGIPPPGASDDAKKDSGVYYQATDEQSARRKPSKKKRKKLRQKGESTAKFDQFQSKLPGGGEKGASTNTGNASGLAGLPNFKVSDIYKQDEWIFLKRGFDPEYCWKVYHMRLLLNKRYKETGKVREFRFALILDDEIDIKTGLIREVCLTWRNKGITWVQNVQDITNVDKACRNSAPLFFFGYSNFPERREYICRHYLAPFIPGATIPIKMDEFCRLTQNKCFIFMDHRQRKAYHLDTRTGNVTEMRELQQQAEHDGSLAGTTNPAKMPVGLDAPPSNSSSDPTVLPPRKKRKIRTNKPPPLNTIPTTLKLITK